jgi:hypothetical protein
MPVCQAEAIRETIKNVTVRAPSKKHNKRPHNHYHEKYLELKGRLLKEKQSVKILYIPFNIIEKLAQKISIASLKISFAFKIIFSKQFVSLWFE